MKELTQTMKDALDYMRQHGNTITRYPGGFWARTDWHHGELSFGATTINALESRGLIEWSKHQERSGGNGTFPVEAKIK